MGMTEITGDEVRDVDEIRYGPLADRPTSPKAGYIYAATDTKKWYACFVDNEWVHINPINLTGAIDGDFFAFDGATGFLKPKAIAVNSIRYGLEADLPASPVVGDIYMTTDTELIYYCFTAGVWDASYLLRAKISAFVLDVDGDITIEQLPIFTEDGNGDMMPSEDGIEDLYFEIVSGEITPKA